MGDGIFGGDRDAHSGVVGGPLKPVDQLRRDRRVDPGARCFRLWRRGGRFVAGGSGFHDVAQRGYLVEQAGKVVASLPCNPTAAAPIARFCGETIFPSTPPELLPAAISTGESPAFDAAVTCRAPNNELAEVSEPVTAVPSQPKMGDSNAKAPPVPAIQVPSVMVCPDAFITNANASTAITVMIAHRS